MKASRCRILDETFVQESMLSIVLILYWGLQIYLGFTGGFSWYQFNDQTMAEFAYLNALIGVPFLYFMIAVLGIGVAWIPWSLAINNGWEVTNNG